MELKKEYILHRLIFYFIILLGFFKVLCDLFLMLISGYKSLYHFIGIAVAGFIIGFICMMVLFLYYFHTFLNSAKKIVLCYKNDILNLKFIKLIKGMDEYNINLSEVIKYEERLVPTIISIFGRIRKGIFYYKDDSTVEIPFLSHRELRNDLLKILENYRIDVILK